MLQVLWREAEEVKLVRNALMCEACLSPRAMVSSGSMLLLRTMSESIALLKPGSVLTDVYGSCYHQRPCRCPRSGLTPEVILVPKVYATTKDIHNRGSLHCHPGPWCCLGSQLWLEAMSESMALQHPGSVLMFMAPVTVEGHMTASRV